MPIELVVLLEDDATEEEQKEIARELCVLPGVIGIYRSCKTDLEKQTTHAAPGMTQ